MTVKELLNDPTFNNSSISKNVFGNARIISDKQNNNRGKVWKDHDYQAIKKYFEENYKINLELT